MNNSKQLKPILVSPDLHRKAKMLAALQGRDLHILADEVFTRYIAEQQRVTNSKQGEK